MSDLIAIMIDKAKQALSHAYAPYSNFRVASCLCSEDGSLYTGVNVENNSYSLTLCAEASALCQMVAAGQQRIAALVIMNAKGTLCPPCGACRQRIAEFSKANTAIHLCSHHAVIKSFTLDELLPHAFRPENR